MSACNFENPYKARRILDNYWAIIIPLPTGASFVLLITIKACAYDVLPIHRVSLPLHAPFEKHHSKFITEPQVEVDLRPVEAQTIIVSTPDNLVPTMKPLLPCPPNYNKAQNLPWWLEKCWAIKALLLTLEDLTTLPPPPSARPL